MVINKIGDIEFRLKELIDFTWLKKYGTAFSAIDETGSGCLCLGMKNGKNRYFCKIAGVNTIEAEVEPQESVKILKNSVQIYRDLKHPNLIEIIENYAYEDFYIVVFNWVDGMCLFDHWNFEKYSKNPTLKRPSQLFKELPIPKKLQSLDVIFSFLINTHKNNYVAVDFYDGSIIYNFKENLTTICDIDYFRKVPVNNDTGEDWFGTKRLKAPEEYKLGAVIDEVTNIFTVGALIFDFFGSFDKYEIRKRYETNCFYSCTFDKWSLNQKCYELAIKATQDDRVKRFQNWNEFYTAWIDASNEFKAPTITYSKLTNQNFNLNSLDHFKRYQEVKESFRLINNKHVLVPNEYTEDWDLIKRRKVAEGVLEAIEQKAIVYGAFMQGEVIGFIYLSNTLFGSSNQYIELLMFQVSKPYRNIGIGKELFKCASESARLRGIPKLNISAHSSKESQAAYRKIGCIDAMEINKTIAANEPFDIQMEYQL